MNFRSRKMSEITYGGGIQTTADWVAHVYLSSLCLHWVLTAAQQASLLACFRLSYPSACRILVPQSGIEPVPPAIEAQVLNHWTAREVPVMLCLFGLGYTACEISVTDQGSNPSPLQCKCSG